MSSACDLLKISPRYLAGVNVSTDTESVSLCGAKMFAKISALPLLILLLVSASSLPFQMKIASNFESISDDFLAQNPLLVYDVFPSNSLNESMFS